METSLNWFVLVGAGLIDSINPCAIGVLVFLLAYLVESNKTSLQILKHGLVYLLAVFLTYLLAGVFLLPIIQSLGNFSVNAYIAIAIIVAVFGIIEIREFFKPGDSSILEIPSRYSQKIKLRKDKMLNNYGFTFLMGAFVAIVELPCTGAVYLAILTLMSQSGLVVSNIVMLIAYNLLFILPLVIILIVFYKGVSSERITTVVNKYKPYMRLATGILLLLLALWMARFALV